MLLRTLFLGSTFLVLHNVSAEETPVAKGSSEHCPTDACLTREAPHAACVHACRAEKDRVTKIATRDESHLLLLKKHAELDRLQREIQRLQAGTRATQQILIQVQMLEVSLTKLRKVAANADWFAQGYLKRADIRQLLGAAGTRADGRVADPSAETEASDSLRFVDWLKKNNLAKVLSAPTLVTMSNCPVSANIGGEFPVPTNNGSKAAVEFRKFGTQLHVLALALGDDQLQLEVSTRVSAIDYDHAIEIQGARIPGLKVREYNTALDLSSGQTAILTGLVEQRTEAHQVDGGRIEEVLVDVGLMVVVTPKLAATVETSAARANRDTRSTTKK